MAVVVVMVDITGFSDNGDFDKNALKKEKKEKEKKYGVGVRGLGVGGGVGGGVARRTTTT